MWHLGTLSLGLFAAGKYVLPTPTCAEVSTVLTGVFYGGFGIPVSQAIGSFATTAATFIASMFRSTLNKRWNLTCLA